MEAEKVCADSINSIHNSDSSSEHRTGMKLPKLHEFHEAEEKVDA